LPSLPALNTSFGHEPARALPLSPFEQPVEYDGKEGKKTARALRLNLFDEPASYDDEL
jgi:hypothetical protein